jgi:hypothetical protein
VPNFFPRDASRPKDDSRKPVAIVGVDPKSNEVMVEFSSICEAYKAGYRNISTVLSNSRQLAKGLRWFRLRTFDKNGIPAMKRASNGKAVRCVETGKTYRVFWKRPMMFGRPGLPYHPHTSHQSAKVDASSRVVTDGNTLELGPETEPFFVVPFTRLFLHAGICRRLFKNQKICTHILKGRFQRLTLCIYYVQKSVSK